MKPKLILFDFDGTLADSRQLFFDLYNELALQRGYVLLTEANISELRNLSIAERCKKMGIPFYRIPFIASAIIKQYKGNINRIHYIPASGICLPNCMRWESRTPCFHLIPVKTSPRFLSIMV